MYWAETLYGTQPQIPGGTAGVSKPTAGMSLDRDGLSGAAALIDPRNPLFVFGVLLAATLGAIGVSGSARLGPAKVSADLGDA